MQSIQTINSKKAYEHKLQRFQETGEYPNSVSPDCFISDLKDQLRGNRRYNYDKQMLVNASLKEYFPELDQVIAGVALFEFCKRLPQVEKDFTEAKERLEQYQEKFSLIQLGETAGKSVQEIWTGLEENDQN